MMISFKEAKKIRRLFVEWPRNKVTNKDTGVVGKIVWKKVNGKNVAFVEESVIA